MRTLHDQIKEHLEALGKMYVLSVGSMETKTLSGSTLHGDALMPELMVTLKIYARRPREGELPTYILEDRGFEQLPAQPMLIEQERTVTTRQRALRNGAACCESYCDKVADYSIHSVLLTKSGGRKNITVHHCYAHRDQAQAKTEEIIKRLSDEDASA